MIGLGTQDSLGEAEDFIDRYGTESFTMLWDASYDSWAVLGVTSQPTAVMFAADGSVLSGWRGMFPTDEVLRLAAESQAAG